MIYKPKFSIVIPCYNCEKYISYCLDSIINQNYDNIEVLCLDDCSVDKTCQIISEYAKKDERIHLIKNNINQGPGILRNLGMKKANGDYLLFSDSDDWFEDGLFLKLAEVIKKYPDINIIEFRFNLAQNEQEKMEANWLNRGESGIRQIDDEDIMLATGLVNKCWKKSFMLKYNLRCCITNRSGEEIPCHICAFLLNKEFYYLNKVGYNWRIVPNSLSHDPKKDREFLHGVWVMLDELKSELIRLDIYHEKNYLYYCATILNWHINEKFSFSKYYKDYYIAVRNFMKQYQTYLETNKSFKKIIKRPYIVMYLSKIIKQIKAFIKRFIGNLTINKRIVK